MTIVWIPIIVFFRRIDRHTSFPRSTIVWIPINFLPNVWWVRECFSMWDFFFAMSEFFCQYENFLPVSEFFFPCEIFFPVWNFFGKCLVSVRVLECICASVKSVFVQVWRRIVVVHREGFSSTQEHKNGSWTNPLPTKFVQRLVLPPSLHLIKKGMLHADKKKMTIKRPVKPPLSLGSPRPSLPLGHPHTCWQTHRHAICTGG